MWSVKKLRQRKDGERLSSAGSSCGVKLACICTSGRIDISSGDREAFTKYYDKTEFGVMGALVWNCRWSRIPLFTQPEIYELRLDNHLNCLRRNRRKNWLLGPRNEAEGNEPSPSEQSNHKNIILVAPVATSRSDAGVCLGLGLRRPYSKLEVCVTQVNGKVVYMGNEIEVNVVWERMIYLDRFRKPRSLYIIGGKVW